MINPLVKPDTKSVPVNFLKMFGFGASKKEATRHINTVLEFQAVLHRETARASRRNAPLSLVLVEKTEKVFEFLGTVSYSRLRLSDVIGMYTPEKIGILLPDTTPDGAKKLIENIDTELAGKRKVHMSYIIHTYPSPDWPVSI